MSRGGRSCSTRSSSRKIRRREQDRDDRRPRLELPIHEQPTQRQNDRAEREEAPQRGVVIIDYSVPAAP